MTRQAVLVAWLVAMGAFQPAPVGAHEDEKAKPDFHAGKCEGNLDEDCFHEEIGKLTSDLQDKHKKYHPVVERIGKWLDQVHHKFHGIREQKVKEGTQLPVTRGELDSFGGAVDKRASLSEAYIEYRRDDDNPQSVERVKKLKAEYERLSESLTAGTEAEKSLIAVFQEVAKPRGGRWGREGRHSRDNPFSDVFEDIAEQIGKGRPEEAAKQAGQIIAVDPRSAEAYSLRAAANYDLKDYNAAVADARTALRLNPDDPTAAAVLKFAESRGGGSGGGVDSSVGSGAAGEGFSGGGLAARDSLTAPGPSAGQSDGLIHQAKSALVMKDFKASLDYSGRAIELNPRNAQAYNLRATAYSRTGQFDKALKDAVAGLAFDPKNGVLLKTKAHVLNKMGQYREALAAANAALEADPRDALAYRLRGEALAGMGDRDGALESLRNAARFDPAYGPLHQAAVQLPENSDILLLFAEGPAAVAPAATRAASSRNRRFTAVAASSLIGGLLVALGLIHIFKDPLKKGLTSVFTKVAAGVSRSGSRRTARRGLPSILRGQYTVSREIGSGGMGMVYEGFDTSLERRVAIKRMRDELRRNPRERERFVTEARLVAGLHHPHIVDIYSIVEEGSEVYLIFEYVAGRTVHEIISQRGKLTFGEAMAIFRGICSALEYAHGRGVIHRDLKPSNVMITEDGYVKVMDFGIARAAKDLASRHAMTNTVVGTPPYMAPEQEQGHVRKESDVYSLAVCLYEMLTGSMPFNGSGGGMFMNKYQRNYAAASHLAEGLPQGIDEVLSRAFDPDPDRRFHGAKELLSALDALNSVKAKA